ncbi:Transcriptional regulator NanR [Neomoorella glycerini]|uniref:Transcriptional regulator NanR n=1 Tax=Neomoorella glycerini TaxID=55779 RepID=A0A6I5ZPC1_9FIRM|nr:FadR/GntR family transcriptional regulator [Moorella glycerini]QGP91381.1 Transcriptional regulator NanR [Moorella glycerini]
MVLDQARIPNGGMLTNGITSEIIQRLLEDIRARKYAPGDKLPSERELCARFSAGRGSVREALRVLQAMGLIRVISGKGTYIADKREGEGNFYALWNSVYPIPIQDLVEARFAIEPLAAAMAAVRGHDRDLSFLAETLRAMEQSAEVDRLEKRVEADVQFHMGILRLAGNTLFIDLFQNIDSMLRDSRRISLLLPERVGRVRDFHRRIYQAIEAGDACSAYSAMWQHLDAFRQDMNIEIDFAHLAPPSLKGTSTQNGR